MSRIGNKEDGVLVLRCYAKGIKLKIVIKYPYLGLGISSNKLSWSFQSGLLPSNAQVTNSGHLLITNFDRFNLGTYTCSAESSTQRLSKSIEFQPNNIFNNKEPSLSFQIYSSRSDYHFGGRLLIECISSGIIV